MRRQKVSENKDCHINLGSALSKNNTYKNNITMIGDPFIQEKSFCTKLYNCLNHADHICFARASSYVTDFNTRNNLLTQKLLKQGYRYHKIRKTFSKFYIRYYDLISKFHVGLTSLLRQGFSEPEFYGDLVYKLKKIVVSNNFHGSSLKKISL